MVKHATFILFFLLNTSLSVFAEPIASLNWVGCGISKKAYVTDLAVGFEKKTNIHINVQGGGATRGIRDVAAFNADLGGSCRYRLPNDPREAGAGFSPVAWDALVIITHKNNPVETLSVDQIKGIYTGKITNWKEVGGPDAPIKLYTRQSQFSGVGRTIRKLLFADYDFKLASTQAFKSSGPLEKAIVTTPYSVGITGISSAKLRDLKIMKLDGVYPSYENIRKGNYQLYRPLYITYNVRSEKINLVNKFIKYTHSREGRAIMRSNGTLPYREAMQLVMKQINQDLSSFRDGADLSSDTNQ